MKVNLKHRLNELEARIPTPRVSLDELVERVRALYPNEAEMWAAYERTKTLESSELEADVEEYCETMKFILRRIQSLKAEITQPSK